LGRGSNNAQAPDQGRHYEAEKQLGTNEELKLRTDHREAGCKATFNHVRESNLSGYSVNRKGTSFTVSRCDLERFVSKGIRGKVKSRFFSPEICRIQASRDDILANDDRGFATSARLRAKEIAGCLHRTGPAPRE